MLVLLITAAMICGVALFAIARDRDLSGQVGNGWFSIQVSGPQANEDRVR